ncbi:hypothetical protein ACEU6E_10740 (plasmid) [Halorutilales archaeon Cl-col2-1]
MSVGHFYDAGGYVDHGDISDRIPVKALSAELHQYRNAELKLQEVKSEEVVAVSPTSLASSYFLTQHPLTAIEVESLPESVRASITEDEDIDLSQFEILQIGRQRRESQNRIISEFK